MKRIEETYREQGFKVIWIGFQDKEEKIREYMTKHDINASVGFDKRERISKKYGIRYGAGIVVINREGIVKKRIPKGASEKALLDAVNPVVGEGGAAGR